VDRVHIRPNHGILDERVPPEDLAPYVEGVVAVVCEDEGVHEREEPDAGDGHERRQRQRDRSRADAALWGRKCTAHAAAAV